MNTVSEAELREALRPYRPDRERFQRAVAQKLATHVAGGTSPRSCAGPAPSGAELDEPIGEGAHLSAAASVLPLGVLDPSAAGLPAACLPSSSKGLATTLALPAISLAMLAVAFFGGVRSVLAMRTSAAATREAADRAARAWWRQHVWRAVGVLALVLALRWTQPIEALVVVVLGSMVALASVLAQLSRAGAASRATVGLFTANLLAATTGATLVFGALEVGVDNEPWKDPWVTFVLLTGWVACDRIGAWNSRWSATRRLVAIGLPLLLLGGLAARFQSQLVALDRERLVAFVDEFDAPVSDVVEWQRFGTIAEWLGRTSSGPLDLETARQLTERTLAAPDVRHEPLRASAPAHSLLGAARAGLVSQRAWNSIAEDSEAQRILAHEGPLLESAITEWLVRAAAATGAPAAVRNRLAERLAAAWPAADAPRAVHTMELYAELCAVLERPLTVEPRPGSTRDALEYNWTLSAAAGSTSAGFVMDTTNLEHTDADIHRVSPTLAAVRLMRRFGVPPGIDLDSVEAFLRRAATPSLVEALSPRVFDQLRVQSYRFVAEVALRELLELRTERALSTRPASASSRVLDHRLLLGALGLVVLCLLATSRAARDEAQRSASRTA